MDLRCKFGVDCSLPARDIAIFTSGKIIQLNEYGCRDAPCKKSWKQGYPLSNTIKDTSTIMRNPLPELCRQGLRMIVLVSLIVLLRGYPCFHDFLHGASLYPYSNDFSACSTYYFSGSRINAATRMRTYMRSAAPLLRVSLVKWVEVLATARVRCCCFISCVDFVKRHCA